MIIADRIKKGIEKYGGENILVHPIPRTSLWLVCEAVKNKNQLLSNSWNISIGNPLGTKLRLVSQDVTNEQHLELWKKLVQIEVEARRKDSKKLN